MVIDLPKGKKIYFASDFHLGVPTHEESRKREDKIVRWLDMAQQDAAHIFLVGDMFDFWFEYRTVIPKGFIRFQGKLAEITDKGIPVTFFTGNHDMWIFDYFTKELGIEVIRKPIDFTVNNQSFMLGHGDGLGPGDNTYKVLKKIFANPLCQWLFGFIHPSIGMWIANTWSGSSRKKNVVKDAGFNGKEGEWLWHYCKEQEGVQHRDFYIFGHRHLPMDLEVTEESRYINLGEWLSHYTYASFDGENVQLQTFEA